MLPSSVPERVATPPESADVTINGVGDVDVHGDPVRLEKAVHGLGSIARK